MSSSELEKRAKQNSADWHTDVGQRSSYEAENKAIKAELDKRNGTKSTLDTTTGKWTTTGGAAKPSSGSGMSSADILALGKGPLSSEAAANYKATGSTKPTTSYNVVHNAPDPERQTPVVYQGYTQEQMNKAIQEALEKQKQQSQYDLTEYLKKQKAAEVESALAGLKGAYEQSMAGYQSAGDRLRESYDAARNTAAAQDAIARRAFQEQAAASGLNSGTAGQAELARSSALTGELARIGEAQAGAEAELELQKKSLQSQYETAIAQARQNGDSQLASALYQELVRVQGLDRTDGQLAYNRDQTAEQLAYNRGQTARKEAQDRVGAYLAAMGSVDGLDAALVEQSGYTQGELSALANYYAKQLGAQSAQKPTLTAAQVNEAIKNGNLAPNVLSAYEYYYGVPYGGSGGGHSLTSGRGGTSTLSGTVTPSTPTQEGKKAPVSAYNWENLDEYGSVPDTVTRDPLLTKPVTQLDWENRDSYETVPGTAQAGVSLDQVDAISGAAPSAGPLRLRPYAANMLNRILTNESVRRNASTLISNALRMQNINNDEASYMLAQLGY